jgi:CDP-diacylglycerol---glycerol-3-phosphate 3-phosphatidyltransferase
LDPLADKLLISAALILLVQRNEIAAWIAVIIVSREMMVTAMRLSLAGRGEVHSAGWLGKAKMVSQSIAIMILLLQAEPINLFTSLIIGDIAILTAVVLTVYSGADYMVKNIKLINDPKASNEEIGDFE